MIYRWILELKLTAADVCREAAPGAMTWKELAEADIAEMDFADVDPVLRTEVEFEQDDPDADDAPGEWKC